MLKHIRFVIMVVIVAAGCQCKKPNDPLPPNPEMPSITGKWEASGKFSGISFLVVASLVQADGDTNFNGTGKLSALTSSRDFSVVGVNSHPGVSMRFFGGGDTLSWGGKFDELNDNRIDGLLQAPAFGLKDYPLLFNRTGVELHEPSDKVVTWSKN